MMQLFRANADLYETEDEVVAKFDLPGVNEEDIDIQIVDDNLQVRVERMSEAEERRENAFLLERSFSGYFRSVPIPDVADKDNVSADYEDGVLTVRFPIREGAQRGGARAGGGGIAVRRVVTPYQQALSREEMLKQGTESPLYRAGTGSYYPGTFVKPTGGAAPESSFSAGSIREEDLARREAAVAQREAEVSRREMAVGSGAYQERLKREEMMRQGTDSPLYRSGTGTYYSETFERPSGEAAPEAYFGGGTSPERLASISRREAEVARREAEVAKRETGAPAPYQKPLTREEMLRQGSESPMYRSGTGSYYPGTFEKPTGPTAPESSFGRSETITEAGELRRRGTREKRVSPR